MYSAETPIVTFPAPCRKQMVAVKKGREEREAQQQQTLDWGRGAGGWKGGREEEKVQMAMEIIKDPFRRKVLFQRIGIVMVRALVDTDRQIDRQTDRQIDRHTET